MIRVQVLAAACLAALASASPALAFSLTSTAPGQSAGAQLVDPDEALGGLFKQFAGTAAPEAREPPALRGTPVIYDLTHIDRGSRLRDGRADLARHPGDPEFNPFMGGAPDGTRQDR